MSPFIHTGRPRKQSSRLLAWRQIVLKNTQGTSMRASSLQVKNDQFIEKKGTSENHLVQLPDQSRVNYKFRLCCLEPLSRWWELYSWPVSFYTQSVEWDTPTSLVEVSGEVASVPGPMEGQTSVLESVVARGEPDHGGTVSSWVTSFFLLTERKT